MYLTICNLLVRTSLLIKSTSSDKWQSHSHIFPCVRRGHALRTYTSSKKCICIGQNVLSIFYSVGFLLLAPLQVCGGTNNPIE